MAAGSPNLTSEQQMAIRTRRSSVALSAGAGSGKTLVVTHRFLSYLDPSGLFTEESLTRLDQLIAITFTERAARQMRERIRKECRRRLVTSTSNAHAEHWLALLRSLDSARISTIHSFCASLLRTHAVEAKLDPHFTILEPVESHALLTELISDELRARLSEQQEATMQLTLRFGLSNLPRKIIDLLDNRHLIDWELWAKTTPDELVERWHQYWQQRTCPLLLQQIRTSPAAKIVIELLSEHVPTNKVMQERREQILDGLVPSPSGKDPALAHLAEFLEELGDNARVQGGGNASVWPSPEIYAQIKDAFTDLRNAAKKLKDRVRWEPATAKQAAELGLQLLQVSRQVSTQYELRKAELSTLDFDDLIARARDLLASPSNKSLKKRLAQNLKLLMIDEFQDTDPLQAELVELLCGSDLSLGKLFFVGDHKQSIYRFRGADPTVFSRLREQLPQPGRLSLGQNFRSQPAILNFVNYLFVKALDQPETFQPLRPSYQQLTPEPAIEFLWALPADDEQRDAERSYPGSFNEWRNARARRTREARWIARRVKQILDGGRALVRDGHAKPPRLRPVRPGDIAILFRAMSDVSLYEAALDELGLPYYVVGGHAFYMQQEVFDLLNVLRSLAKPADEVSLAGALRSPFFSLSDESLFWLTKAGGSLSAGLQLTELPPEMPAEQQTRVRFAGQTLTDLRAVKDRLPIADLIGQVLARTGYDATLLSEFLGDRKLANLEKLLDMARRFDRSGLFTLDDYLTQLADFVENAPKEAPAATQAEDSDVIRLMTIHQAKGLEFPVVVVPDVVRDVQGSGDAVAFTRELGPLLRLPAGLTETPAVTGMTLHDCNEQAAAEEEALRLFYVATTRAADYLILSSGINDLEKVPHSPWIDLLGERFDLATGELLDLDSVERLTQEVTADSFQAPRVQVITEEPPLPEEAVPVARRPNWSLIATAARQADTAPVPSLVPPIPPDPLGRRQFSVSRLHGILEEYHAADTVAEVSEVPPPVVNEVARQAAQDLGTLVHGVLEELDFKQPKDLNLLVQSQVAWLGSTVTEQAQSEATKLLTQFIETPRRLELAAAKQILPEVEFLFAWPPGGAADPDGVYLRGYLDVLFQDAAGAWHILDYKTNRVTSENYAQTCATYEMQMLFYGLVAQQVLRTPPASLILHFMRTSQEHVWHWNESLAARAQALVNEAILIARQGAPIPAGKSSI